MNYECDPTLVAEVRRYGHFDVAGCFNCGTCTLSCDLAGEYVSFPRRSTRQVLMGLRPMVNESLDPWICHDCGDCSTACPRQTGPREAMMTLRRYLAAVYDWTGISAKINSSTAWHVGALSIAATLVLALIVCYHVYSVKMPLAEFASSPMGLEHMFPMMTYFTLVVVLFPFFILLTNAFRMYWFTVHQKESIRSPLSQCLIEAKTFMLHFFTYKKMVECPTEKMRWPKHLLLGLGCMAMLAITVFGLRWFQTDKIYPLYHPQRWVGYLATAFLIFGTGDILLSRMRKEREVHKTSDFLDWNFPVLLLATAVSGIVVHVLRYLGLELATHYAYAVHLLITVPMLVVEMPFGKWTHMIYRPLAMYFLSLRERTVAQTASSEGVPAYVS
ncbi:MAG: 4Fe-4S dicluster domain-containing protein [Syntrophorhabdales bacterium]